MPTLGRWLFRVLVSLDQLGNTILGGDPDETLSSRAGKARDRGAWWGRATCRVLDRLDPGHCADAIEPDRGDVWASFHPYRSGGPPADR